MFKTCKIDEQQWASLFQLQVNDEVLDRFFSFERRPCADDFTAPQPKAAAAGGGGKKKKGKKTKKSNQENKPAAPEAVVAMDPAS